jgi:hypothetical protein
LCPTPDHHEHEQRRGAKCKSAGKEKKTAKVCTSGKVKMEKNFVVFTFGAVPFYYKGRSALSHSHYCLICASR